MRRAALATARAAIAMCAILTLCAILALSGCTRGGDSAGETELTFWGMGREGEVVGELIAAWDAQHDDVSVNVQ